MATTNYGFQVPTGSALVNPLTIDTPNWEKVDDLIKKNQDNSIQEATELISGKVHAISCLETGAIYMHFTATGDYRSGDTFTFNGAPIAAFLPDGSGLSDYAYRVNSEVLISVIGSRLTVYTYAANSVAENSLNLGGQPPEYYGKATDTISTYTQSYIDTVHNFVGVGANGKVKFVANVNSGDTIQINGQPVTAFAGLEDFVSAYTGKNLVGKTLFFIFDSTNQTVNFCGAGGSNINVPSYSTTETKTGEFWIDGKPVYQKVIQGTTGNANEYTNIPIGSTIDTVISANAFIRNVGDQTIFSMVPGFNGALSSSNHNYFSIFNNQNRTPNVIQLVVGSAGFANSPFTCVIKYTKP